MLFGRTSPLRSHKGVPPPTGAFYCELDQPSIKTQDNFHKIIDFFSLVGFVLPIQIM